MLDIKFIRENVNLVGEAARKKHMEFDPAKMTGVNLDQLLKLDEARLKLMKKIEDARARQNTASAQIPQASDAVKIKLIDEMTELKDGLGKLEVELKGVLGEWKKLMLEVPNVPDMSVPEGDSDADNVELKQVGEKPNFNFTPKSHLDLLGDSGLADFTRGAKVSGFRGYFLTGGAMRLSFALWQFALEELVAQGFTPMLAPALVRPEPFLGTGYLPQGAEDLYKTQDGDYLSGTAEVATMGYFMDEILALESLPKKIVAFSPCFRREAGSHGKDTKGLIRVHEFFKVEQVVICQASHEESVKWHETLTKNAESLMQKLNLPYRVVTNCTGDLGLGQVKKYDLEVWLPGENRYRETHSISYFHDFQTRRLNIRYKNGERMNFAHSLNGTLVATPRLLVGIVENYQNADGTIRVPEVLKKYLNCDTLSL